MNDSIKLLEETGRWRARDVVYWSGRWSQLQTQIPQFVLADFKASDGAPANPNLRSVVRQPRTLFEQPIPVGVVSNTYALVQHSNVAEKCFEGIRSAGIKTEDLHCELGLTELGEWMNLRIYFPQRYNYTPQDGKPIVLRLECANSVDGSSCLVILLSWLRLVCSNGMVIRETKTEIRDIHNEHLDLERIPVVVRNAMGIVENDLARLEGWEATPIDVGYLPMWVNGDLVKHWGSKAATRVYHICVSGWDVEFETPFAKGDPTEKPVKRTMKVPGASEPVRNLYDISQALSWVASRRNNPEERLDWQAAIPDLIDALAVTG